MVYRLFILFLIILLSPVSYARMYQWVDPDSGTTQLSGKPPIWYRSHDGGPRTFVIEQGRVVDDTSINVSDDQRELLRQQAFIKVEEDKAEAERIALEAEKLKAAMANGPKENLDTDSISQLLDELEAESEPNVLDEPALVDEEQIQNEITATELRAKIEEWENERTEEAKKLIESDN